MTARKTPNLSEEQNLLKEHDGLDGLPGYVVVPLVRSWRKEYFAVAVNESVLEYSFEVQVGDDDVKLKVKFDLTYRAANPRLLAELYDQDPLKKLVEEIRRRYRSLKRERANLIQYAATLGIEIISLDFDRSSFSPEAASLNYASPAHQKMLAEMVKKRLAVRAGSGAQTKSISDELQDELATDTVVCSVFAPRRARRGGSILVQVFAHLEKDEAIAKAMAAEFDENVQRLGVKRLDQEVERDSKLVFGISIPGLQIDEPVQQMIWRGQPESVQFGVQIPKDFVADQIVGTVYVTQGSIPFGHVKFILQIESVDAPATQKNELPETENTWKRYQYAFISYASPDRSEVLKRVQMLARLRIDFFQDLLTLEPGDRWEQELYKNIDRSDVFFLFWSTAARDSKWVMKEVRYALERKRTDKSGAPEIVPVIIEGPPPVKPPDELKDIHFNDVFLYFMN